MLDYSKYTLEELLDAKNHIDAELYPERAKLLDEMLQTRCQEIADKSAADEVEGDAEDVSERYRDDPIARQINWSPLCSDRFSYAAQRLELVSDSRIELLPSAGLNLSFMFFLLLGSGFILFSFIIDLGLADNQQIGARIFAVLFGSVMVLVVGSYWRFYSTPIVFDKDVGLCWKSRKPLDQVENKSVLEVFVQLDEIYALQILNQLVKKEEYSDYNCFEVNLVMKSSKRINVIAHGNKEVLFEQAEELSSFLDVPIWDRSEQEFDWNSNFKMKLE